jgi:hypothetical protein
VRSSFVGRLGIFGGYGSGRDVRPTALSAERYCRSAANARGSAATDAPVRCNGGLGSVHRGA